MEWILKIICAAFLRALARLFGAKIGLIIQDNWKVLALAIGFLFAGFFSG